MQAQRKLSFKEKHALEKLPSQIAALEDEIRSLEARLADASLFVRDSKLFQSTADRLSEARRALAANEEEWLRLEMLRDELESA